MKKYTDKERKSWNYLRCYDCGLEYSNPKWVDIVLDNETWELINPTYHKGAGLLCFNCIAGRLVELGLSNISIKITSGPFECQKLKKIEKI